MPTELFINPSDGSTFLLDLIASYLKLQERGKLNIIRLSDVFICL